jgi:hypothetical protein
MFGSVIRMQAGPTSLLYLTLFGTYDTSL